MIILTGLLLSIVYLVYKIWPYTPFSKKEMMKVKANDPANEIRIFSANVFQDNRHYDTMLQQIRSADPDLVLLLETNKAWAEGTRELEKDYPYKLKAPLENTYGLLFYSRFKLEESAIQYIVKNDVPSVKTKIVLPSGRKIQIWGLHPEPPVPEENHYSTAKDKELMKVALKVRDCDLPVIVFGDLNDVAWSRTTALFRKTSETLDPRRGRGFYNTFSAYNRFIRFPLDYIFCTPEFGLISMRRMPKNGSDHFAMFTHLAVRKDLRQKQESPKADSKEMQEAKKLATQPVKE